MKKLDALSFDQMLDDALDDAKSGIGLLRLAEQIIDDKKGPLESLIRQWAIERVLTSLRRKRLERGRKAQLRLPGFEAVPLRIPNIDGKGRRLLLNSTYEDLRRYHGALHAKTQQAPKVLQIEGLMSLMRKYHAKGITVREVLDREGIQPRLLVTS